jgi:importin-7
MPILTIINNVLQSNPKSPQKYGALNMTVSLAPFIMRHPDVKDNMEQFLMQHVLPCFSAPEPYLRAVACEVLCAVERVGVKWTDDQVCRTTRHGELSANPLQNLRHHFTAVAAAMSDEELPVKVHSILALTQMITAHESSS